MKYVEMLDYVNSLDFDTYNIGIMSKKLSDYEKKTLLKKLRNEIKFNNKKHVFENPEIKIIYDYDNENWIVKINPIIIKGIYFKYVRNLPQTPWGKYGYKESVASLIFKHFEKYGSKVIFHGAGREDVDVLNLGGRPFFLEIKDPKTKQINLKKIENLINEDLRIRVKNLTFSNRKEMRKILTEKKNKKYRVLIYCKEKLDVEKVKYFDDYFKNKIIYQRTPLRVSHRRADKIRIKKVHWIKSKKIDDYCLDVIVYGDHGLYIKELVHGDQGRTRPSFSDYFGKELKVVELDVIGFG